MKIFIAGYDVMGKSMAGPGMRSWEIACFLSKHADVTLSFDDASDIQTDKTDVLLIRDSAISWDDPEFWNNFDLAILPGSQTLKTSLPPKFPIPLIVDIYDPYILENIYLLSSKQPAIREHEYLRHLKALLEILLIADRLIITSDRTMDFFNGVLCSWGYMNPITASDNYKKHFLIIPFGIPNQSFDYEIKHSQSVLPPIIKPDHSLILWAGGLWDWLDPLCLIESMPLVLKEHQNALLYFMGYKHPNKHVPVMNVALDSMEKAKKLGLLNKSVVFHEWTFFKDRIPLLAHAKLGVSLHENHMETRYAFRTRLMDYIWAGIPMVLSDGDILSQELALLGLAETHHDRNPNTIAKSIIRMLNIHNDKSEFADMKTNFSTLILKYEWDNILQPLADDIKTIEKTRPNPYSDMFSELLKAFPSSPKPGFFQKGVQIIKNHLR